jgi:CheY-like chemotaxis protein
VPLNVLLVEDNPGEARLTFETFRDANKAVRLHVVSDGVEAMSFLNREGPHAEAPRPVLILLDLNLPKMDGREVLARIKGDPCAQDHSDCHFDDFGCGIGHQKELRAAGELLPDQTGAAGGVRNSRAQRE